MTDFLIYQGKAAIVLAAFYMFYRLLLYKETFHRFNRIMLLGTAVLCFVLPLCVITLNKTVKVAPETNDSAQMTLVEDGMTETVPEMIPMETVEEPAAEPEDVEWWPFVVFGVFITGAVTVLLMSVISIIKVRSIIKSGTRHALESGEILVITDNSIDPFSWMKYIVISREDYESGYSQILTHEKAHIALKHSWDILFVDMITALQWFNPAIWMLKADLRALHEFEADAVVLKSGTDIKEYQYLLIRKAVSKSGYSVANSFNHSTLKARITMMLNKKSSRMSVWKALYVIPLVGISLAATAETKVDYRYEDQQPEAVADTLMGKDSEKSFPEPENPFTKKNLREGRFIVDKENNTVTLIYFDTDCKELQVCYIGLDLNQNIYLHNGAIVTKEMMNKAAHDDPDAVMIVAYLKDDNRVSTAITTTGPYVTGTINLNEKKPKEAVPFQQVTQKPTFNGGDANEFTKWVNENLRYPEECRQSMVQGRVTLQFTVTETGKVADVKVLRGVNPELDKEAVRVVSESPLWTPGKNVKGEIVPISYVFPVIFKLP